MEQIIASIRMMIATENRLELPKEKMANYTQVKNHLTKAGGKYSKNGFTFKSDAKVIQDRLCGGEKINDKKKYQFFPTPKSLAQQLVKLAEIKPTDQCLEPSAGHGAIASEILKFSKNLSVVELNEECREVLTSNGYELVGEDFLEFVKGNPGHYHKIVANPPFSNRQDIDHVRAMESILAPGGRLVSIMSPSWMTGDFKKQVEFREYLEDFKITVFQVERGTFRESGTEIATMILVLDKPEN